MEREATAPVQDRHGVAGEVRKQLLAGAVLLTHRAFERLCPVFIALAELGVAVGPFAGVRLDVFFPQQLQRHVRAPQLAVNDRIGRFDTPGRRALIGWQAQPGLKLVVGQRLDARPVQIGRACARCICRDGTHADTRCPADLAVRQAAHPLQPQDFFQFAHAHPMCRHHLSLTKRDKANARR
jgi:hypothetical protein